MIEQFDPTKNYIECFNREDVQFLFENNHLFFYATEKRDMAKIEKLLTIKTLNNFYEQVRKFTKNVIGDHSIRAWERLAELRYIQIDLQQNYDRETLKNKGAE